MRLITHARLLAWLLVWAAATLPSQHAAATPPKLPVHAGPLTAPEVAQLARSVWRGEVRNMLLAARRALKARVEGRAYRARKYEILLEEHGGRTSAKAVPKHAQPTDQGRLPYAQVLASGEIIATSVLPRREAGKGTETTVEILYVDERPTSGKDGLTYGLSERRTTTSGQSGLTRITERQYDRAYWLNTEVWDSYPQPPLDELLERAPENWPKARGRKTRYEPGHHMGSQTEPDGDTYRRAKGHYAIN